MTSWSDENVPNAAGAVRPGYDGVADAFSQNFLDNLELGASFAAVVDGDLVVDIRGGFRDKAKQEPWTQETLACVYSSGKAILALLVAREVSNGALDYDRPVADYWPAFAENGKQGITIAQVMSHQGGLCGIADEMPPQIWLNWHEITARIASMAPLWPPGTANGYHPQTVGFIVGELLRSVTGKSVGQLLDELRAARGFQVFCGLSADEINRTTFMPKPPKAPDLGEINEFTRLAFLKPWSATARVNRNEWMAAEIPSSNMHGDARSLARMLYPMANQGKWPDGRQYLAPSAIEAALKERIRGDDLVLPFHLSWSAGLMQNINNHFGPNKHAYGHAGFGGSCVVIDPQKKLSAAYVMNKMSPYLVGDPRALRMINGLYDCLDR